MCGVIGVYNLGDRPPVAVDDLLSMLAMIRHRGPDGFGVYRHSQVGLGSARLSIIDLAGGDQPICNEDGGLWIVFNGEIYNYLELRQELENAGHRFATRSDTEVVLHLYEDQGPGCLNRLNGQFVIAIWDERRKRLFLGRDRLGVRPLYYAEYDGRLVFGSEIKALLAFRGLPARIDPLSLDQVFTYWSMLGGRTAFEGISELPPAHYMLAEEGRYTLKPYWTLDFDADSPPRSPESYLEEFEALLLDAVRLRLRADVPVGAYLSGGLDSSTTAAVIRRYTDAPLDTFSITFSDPGFDESPYQRQMVDFLGVRAHQVHCTDEDIGQVFPRVVWHAEMPLLRTSPAPMYLLAKLVHEQSFKVVVTGEGADEMLAGYDIFKEMKIRRFWARQPESKLRPKLLNTLYPDIAGLDKRSGFLTAFFGRNLLDTGSPAYSHAIRWMTSARNRRFLSQAPAVIEDGGWPQDVVQPTGFDGWPPLGKAQFLEIVTFLSPYLLSAQGDRMSMAHSVEGRYPFLDYRLVEFCAQLPPAYKMPGLREKWLLKRFARPLLPAEICRRLKRPYRAPIHPSFFGAAAPDYVAELLSERALAAGGYFVTGAARMLAQKAARGAALSEVEDMALVGILSTQLLDRLFVSQFRAAGFERPPANLRLVDRWKHPQSTTSF